MTASLTVAWRGGASPTIGPVETCDREPAKTGYKSHTQRSGVARDFATLTVPQTQVDREIERLKKGSYSGQEDSSVSHRESSDFQNDKRPG